MNKLHHLNIPSELTGGNWPVHNDVCIVQRAKFENNLNSQHKRTVSINASVLLIIERYFNKDESDLQALTCKGAQDSLSEESMLQHT